MSLVPLKLAGMIADPDFPAIDSEPQKWTMCQGVNFRQGVAQRIQAEAPFLADNASNQRAIHLRNSYFDGVSWWIYGTSGQLRVKSSDPSDVTNGDRIISTSTAGNQPADVSSDAWTSAELNGIPIFNYLKTPVYWLRDPAVRSTELPGWPANSTCKVIRTYKAFIFAFNIYDPAETQQVQPSLVRWSDAAEPGTLPTTWAPAVGNFAGQLSLGAVSEGIVDALVLRDMLMVYKPHSTWIMQFVGGDLLFSSRQLSSTKGAVSANCVAELNGKHIVLMEGDVWITDGNQIKSLVPTRVRNSLFGQIDTANFKECYVVAYPFQSEVWICFPEIGQLYASKALVWNETTDEFAYRTLIFGDRLPDPGCAHLAVGNRTALVASTEQNWSEKTTNWDTDATVWNTFAQSPAIDGLIGSKAMETTGSGLVLVEAIPGQEAPVNPIPMQLLRTGLDFGVRDQQKLVTEVWPRVTGQAGMVLDIRVGTQDEPEDPVTWGAFVPYTLGTSKKVDCKLTARFFAVEIQTDDIRPFRCTGFDVKLIPTSRY